MKLVTLMLAGSILTGAASPQQPQTKPASQKSGQRKAGPNVPSPQPAQQSEADKHLALLEEEVELMRNPGNKKTEAYEASDDECKVFVYRLFLKVPDRNPPKGLEIRKAEWVAMHYRIQATYHVATTERREAQMEAMMLGADPLEAMKIDREFYEAQGDIEGKMTAAKLRYFAGVKLIASQDVLASDAEQADKVFNRMRKLAAWARVKSGNR